MNKQLFFFLIAVYFLCGCFAQSVSTYFDEKDASSLIQTLTNSQKKDGSFLGLKNTYYAINSFQFLKSNIPQKEKVCEFLNSANVVDIESTLYFSGISEGAGCGKTLNDKQKNLLKSSLKSDSLENIYYAISTYSLLSKSKQVTLTDDELLAAFNTLIDLFEDDGTARENTNDEEGSIYHGALALNALAQLGNHLQLKDAQKNKLKQILNNAVAVQGEIGEDTLEYKDEQGETNSLKLTSLYFGGINALSKFIDKKPTFAQKSIIFISEFFMQNKNPSFAEDIYFFLNGLQHAATNVFGKPLVLSLIKTSYSISSKSDSQVKLTLTDLYGKFATKATVFLSEAVAVATKKQIIVNQEIFLAENEKFLYQLNFLATKPEPGSYRLSFRVVPEDETFIPIESSKILKIVGSVSISEVQISVTESGDVHSISEGTSYTVNYPQTLKEHLSLTNTNHLFVSFKLTSGNKAISVHQSFVSIINPTTKDFVTAVAEKKNNKYMAHLTIDASQFHAHNGTYDLVLTIGDSYIDNSFVWKAASLDVKFPASLAVPEPEPIWQPKKPIQWTQRPPENRPSKTISSAFTILALVPLFILLIGLISVGANISNFPTAPDAFFHAVGFQAGIGAVLFLFGVYWLALNMVQTLTYFAFISIPAFYCGVRTLNYLSSKSLKSD